VQAIQSAVGEAIFAQADVGNANEIKSSINAAVSNGAALMWSSSTPP
jgi:hypothetical protein